MKPKKRAWRIVACCLGLILLLGLGAAVSHWQQLRSVYRAVTSTPEELQQSRQEREKQVEEALAQLPPLALTPLTDEERQQLREGSLSEEEALERMLGGLDDTSIPPPSVTAPTAAPTAVPTAVPTAAPTAASTATPIATPASLPGSPPAERPNSSPVPIKETAVPEEGDAALAEAQAVEQLRELVAQVYIMRDSYVARLDGIKAKAIQSYLDLPAPKKTKSAQISLLNQCISEAAELEKACDAAMEEVLRQIADHLETMNADQQLVESMRLAYEEEKTQLKAEYLGEAKKRGLIS